MTLARAGPSEPGRRLAFRLCLALGWPHPDYLLELLSPEQLADWSDFYDLEPWGFDLDEARFGMIGSMIAATAGAKVPPSKFMRPPPEDPEPDPLFAKLKRMFGYRPPEARPRSKGD